MDWLLSKSPAGYFPQEYWNGKLAINTLADCVSRGRFIIVISSRCVVCSQYKQQLIFSERRHIVAKARWKVIAWAWRICLIPVFYLYKGRNTDSYDSFIKEENSIKRSSGRKKLVHKTAWWPLNVPIAVFCTGISRLAMTRQPTCSVI